MMLILEIAAGVLLAIVVLAAWHGHREHRRWVERVGAFDRLSPKGRECTARLAFELWAASVSHPRVGKMGGKRPSSFLSVCNNYVFIA